MLYLVECEKDNEKFYKVGITVNSISERFKGSRMPYKVRLVDNLVGSPEHIFDLEKLIQREMKAYKYFPKLRMEGRTECFEYNSIILKMFRKYVCLENSKS